MAEPWRAISDDAHFVYKSWLEAADARRLRRFYDETLRWISINQDGERCDFVLESWLDKRLDFGPVAEAAYRSVRRLRSDPNGAFILKHVVRQKQLPTDVVRAALYWCATFPKHEDGLTRLGPLVGSVGAGVVGVEALVRIAAIVLSHQSVDELVLDPWKTATARATVGSLFTIGENYRPAEMIARIYFVRWLRDGRIFCPAPPGRSEDKNKMPIFDQKFSLVEALLTVMVYEEFVPSNRDDADILIKFCDWVGEWRFQSPYLSSFVAELVERFGSKNIWQRMLGASLSQCS